MLSKLQGWKTYISALFLALAAAMPILGYEEHVPTLLMLAGALGLVGIRSAMKKQEPPA